MHLLGGFLQWVMEGGSVTTAACGGPEWGSSFSGVGAPCVKSGIDLEGSLCSQGKRDRQLPGRFQGKTSRKPVGGVWVLTAALPCPAQAEQELRVAQTEFDRQAEVTRLLLEGISSTHVSPPPTFTKAQPSACTWCA